MFLLTFIYHVLTHKRLFVRCHIFSCCLFVRRIDTSCFWRKEKRRAAAREIPHNQDGRGTLPPRRWPGSRRSRPRTWRERGRWRLVARVGEGFAVPSLPSARASRARAGAASVRVGGALLPSHREQPAGGVLASHPGGSERSSHQGDARGGRQAQPRVGDGVRGEPHPQPPPREQSAPPRRGADGRHARPRDGRARLRAPVPQAQALGIPGSYSKLRICRELRRRARRAPGARARGRTRGVPRAPRGARPERRRPRPLASPAAPRGGLRARRQGKGAQGQRFPARGRVRPPQRPGEDSGTTRHGQVHHHLPRHHPTRAARSTRPRHVQPQRRHRVHRAEARGVRRGDSRRRRSGSHREHRAETSLGRQGGIASEGSRRRGGVAGRFSERGGARGGEIGSGRSDGEVPAGAVHHREHVAAAPRVGRTRKTTAPRAHGGGGRVRMHPGVVDGAAAQPSTAESRLTGRSQPASAVFARAPAGAQGHGTRSEHA